MTNTSLNAKVKVKAQEIDPALIRSCTMEEAEDACCIVIFGATGDLTSRKLFPALLDLLASGSMPREFHVVGAGRTELSDEMFRERMRESLLEQKCDMTEWGQIESRLSYRQVQYESLDSYKDLAGFLEELDARRNLGGNRLFYLAVPPMVYEDIARNLGLAGLAGEAKGYSRLAIEKPFGHDLVTAQALDSVIHQHFAEHQIFRMDHYLAKETVQNILVMRFANAIFEPIWNRNYIDYIVITASEILGVGHRAGFYDHAGVLRDMFQNHMMQLLALCAMEPPSRFEADVVRDEKSRLYRALRPFPLDQINEHLILGQYSAGEIEGKAVPAYVQEPGVASNSLTPTYAAMKVYVDNWRWQGVPFYMVSGKRLAEKRTEIRVRFKEVPYSMFRHVLGEHITANELILGIQPKEGVTLTFQAKVPGPMCLRSVTMDFRFDQGFPGPKIEAYARVLKDCMIGDQTLFWRQDGVELCWGFLTPILKRCDCPDDSERLLLYKAGSWGPQAARRMLGELE